MIDFVGKNVTQAYDLADSKSFQIVISDSVFIVGKNGGIILNQNPKPFSEVKKGRKVYVTISKFDPDKISVSELPLLYGNDYTQKTIELQNRGILTKVKSKKYDSGDPNHILEVYYKGELIIDQNTFKNNVKIDKGDYLEFVVSNRDGGEITIPDLICLSVSEAEFMLSESQLFRGELIVKGAIKDTSAAYIIDQNPTFDGISKIPMNSKITLTIVSNKPIKCK